MLQVSKKYVSKETAQKIHDKAAPFIKWLKEVGNSWEGLVASGIGIRSQGKESKTPGAGGRGSFLGVPEEGGERVESAGQSRCRAKDSHEPLSMLHI